MSDNNEPNGQDTTGAEESSDQAAFPWQNQPGALDEADESDVIDAAAVPPVPEPPAYEPPATPDPTFSAGSDPEPPAYESDVTSNSVYGAQPAGYDVPPPPPAAPGYGATPSYGGQASVDSPQQYGAAPTTPYGAPSPYSSPAPYGAGAPYGSSAPQQSGGKGLAITALVLSIVGAIMCFVPFAVFVGILIVIAALILSIVALVKKANGKGMSIAALIVAGVGALAGVVMLIITIASLVFINDVIENPDQIYEDYPELFDEDFNEYGF